MAALGYGPRDDLPAVLPGVTAGGGETIAEVQKSEGPGEELCIKRNIDCHFISL